MASRGPARRSVACTALIGAALAAVGCSGYYAHTVWGGLKVLEGRRSVEKMLRDPEVPEELKQQLRFAARAREFAIRHLELRDNKTYRHYKDLERSYATWTVVAAPEFSTVPLRWCFPIAGCVSYRGYFSEERARRYAARMRERGLDVDVGGVRAYSTLGWLADPLLNTFVSLPEVEMVGIIVHELAHQRLYVKGDTGFNESFATTVELEGVRRWLEAVGNPRALADYRAAKRREHQFVELVGATRDRLSTAYSSGRSDVVKSAEKRRLLDELRRQYGELKRAWGETGEYDRWFDEGLNNARLASIGAYYDHVPAFCALLQRCSGSWTCFYREAESIARSRPGERARALRDLLEQATPGATCGLGP